MATNHFSFATIASLELHQVDDETLFLLRKRITAEIDRRKGQKKSTHDVVSAVHARLRGNKAVLRPECALHHPEWLDLYPEVDGDKRFYVYVHARPSKGYFDIEHLPGKPVRIPSAPFYVGKGTGGRAFDLNRNEGHGAELRALLSTGMRREDIAFIVADGLTESQAFRLEAKLIYLLGTRFEPSIVGALVNLEIPKRPLALESFIAPPSLWGGGRPQFGRLDPKTFPKRPRMHA